MTVKSQQSGEVWLFTAGIHKNTKFSKLKKWILCIVNTGDQVADNIPGQEFHLDQHYALIALISSCTDSEAFSFRLSEFSSEKYHSEEDEYDDHTEWEFELSRVLIILVWARFRLSLKIEMDAAVDQPSWFEGSDHLQNLNWTECIFLFQMFNLIHFPQTWFGF